MPQLHATAVLEAGSWPAESEIDQVLLNHDLRHRRRILLRTESGREMLLELKQATHLRQGDGLAVLGGVVRVCARPEALLSITAPDAHLLLRLAWHLGNRHLPVQILPAELRIRADHVIAEMVTGLGGSATPLETPFDPESGAYDAGHGG